MSYKSLPSRERGLKCCTARAAGIGSRVAPFAGAWIEILLRVSQEEGIAVAPFAGAWIEIVEALYSFKIFDGRSLRGSVD